MNKSLILLFLFTGFLSKGICQKISSNGFNSHPIHTEDSSIFYFTKNVVPPNYYSSHLGFFCKQEIKRDKKSIIPIRFRLGSMDYCDKLEGKNKP